MEFSIEPVLGASAPRHFKLRFSDLSEKERHYLAMVEDIPAFHCTVLQDDVNAHTLFFDSRRELEQFALFLGLAKEVAEHFPAHSIRRSLEKQEASESESGSGLGLY